MPVVRKRSIPEKKTGNGLYVHSNPPRVLQITSAHIKHLIRTGDIDRLEQIVFEGQGKKLIGEYAADYKIRTFLKTVPTMMSKISLLHDAVNSDRVEELKAILDEEPAKKKKYIFAKDESGVGLLHKAVYYDLKGIYQYLIQNFSQMVSMKDSEGRTAYHYTPMCKDTQGVQKMLSNAGADPNSLDNKQHSVKYYANHIQELELPSAQKTQPTTRTNTANNESLNFKKSNIRIWIHQRNLTNLQQVVWEGHGSKLLVEHSNNPKIRKFLDAVPNIMGLIKDVHTDVINDDMDSLKNHVAPPIPKTVLSGKDSNGLTPLHKAAGLGKQSIAEYIVTEHPESVIQTDNEGRTPLHYAALLKDDGEMTKFLIDNGADESALDNRQKTAAYYKTRTSELDAKLLHIIPECPRSAKENFGANFDWSMLASHLPLGEVTKAIKKVEKLVTSDEETKKEEVEVEAEAENGDEKANGKDEEANGVDESKEEVNEPEETNGNDEPKEEEEEQINGHTDNPENGDTYSNGEDPDEPKNGHAFAEVQNEEPNENGDANNNEEEEKEVAEPEPAEEPKASEEEPKEDEKDEEPPQENGSQTRPTSKSSRPNSNISVKSKEPELEPEGVIEGVVNGENEVETLNDEGQGGHQESGEDDEIRALVEAGNMEQLAGLVLNGDGQKLVGQSSDNPELQTFLENVPVYMSKINRIHLAAKDGSLRDLQAALDRRKFAIAKDHISPKGASPLHVAVIFGNTSIVRYLAGRFPETIQAVDDDGRTPLHYAATLGDNGHYYNLLVHLGADTRVEDKFGHTAEYYRSHPEEFSHRTILTDFGTEENALEEMLQDKEQDDNCSAKKELDDEDMIQVLEKCYMVLHGRRNSNAISAASTVTLSSTNSSTSSLLIKHMKRYIFDAVKLRLTKFDHNLYDLIWPSVKKLPSEMAFRVALEQDFPAGIVAPDFCVYKVFSEILVPIIKDFNCIDLSPDLPLHPDCKFMENESDTEIELDLDTSNKYIISGTLDCTRNLSTFELPKSINVGQLEDIERIITSVLLSQEVAKALYPNASSEEIEEKGSGIYYTMNEVLEDPSEARVILATNGLLVPLWNIPDSDRLHGKHWPYGRGVFISNSGNLAVWVNVMDHIRIVTCTSHSRPGNIGQIYSRMSRLMTVLNKHLTFRFDDRLGFLSARPTVLGNTLQFNLTLKFPHLIKEADNLRHLCLTRGLTYQRNTNTTDIVKVNNQQSLGITELQTFEDFTTAVINILQLERDLAMSNSLHIAAMFVNIFKKKKTLVA